MFLIYYAIYYTAFINLPVISHSTSYYRGRTLALYSGGTQFKYQHKNLKRNSFQIISCLLILITETARNLYKIHKLNQRAVMLAYTKLMQYTVNTLSSQITSDSLFLILRTSTSVSVVMAVRCVRCWITKAGGNGRFPLCLRPVCYI